MSDLVRKVRLAVLVSGGGTNLQAILDRVASGSLSAEVVAVVSDREDAYGLIRAQKAGVPTHVVDYNGYLQRESRALASKIPAVELDEIDRRQKILKNPDPAKRLERLRRLVVAERELIGVLDRYRPDYICLAGFMRLLSPYFLHHYNRLGEWRVLNIHPALLPAFPGEHGYEDTFSYGCKWGGVTVHFVDEGEDSGPIIAQAIYPVWPRDDVETVRSRGLRLEYEVYSQCIHWLAAGQVELEPLGGNRCGVRITDPAYRPIVESWLKEALS